MPSNQQDSVIATAVLPIFALPFNTVLFPGITVRVNLAPSEAATIITRLNDFAKRIQDPPTLLSTSNHDTNKAIEDAKQYEEVRSLHNILDLKESAANSNSPLITVGVVPRIMNEINSKENNNSNLLLADNIENGSFLTSDLTKSFSSQSAPIKSETLSNVIYPFGIVARVLRVERSFNGKFQAVIEGFNRLHIDEFTKVGDFTEARVSVFAEDSSSSDVKVSIWSREDLEKLESLKLAAIRLISHLSTNMPTANNKSGSQVGNNRFLVKPELLRKILPMVKQTKSRRAAGILTDILAFIIPIEYHDKVKLLEVTSLNQRIDLVTKLMNEYIEAAKITEKIDKSVEDSISKQQREFILRQKLNAIKEELGEKNGGAFKGGMSKGANADNDEDEEISELKKKLDDADIPEEGRKIVNREFKRLKRMHPTQAEYQVCRTYLETIAEVPWSTATFDNLDNDPVARARKILDDDHYGLEKVKKRLLEYLAVLNLKQKHQMKSKAITLKEDSVDPIEDGKKTNASSPTSTALVPYQGDKKSSEPAVHKITSDTKILSLDKSPILLLVGPPGVGKTSLAKSVAHALGRKFHRISLGGVRDEAEIRGHRRTYVGAMPGLLVQALRKVGVVNPVILLDEIDKVSQSNFHGDPSAALLEVLDPEQNHTFTDHYINFPVDLSKTLFIATANYLEDIPGPLLDRMEMISLEGYTYMEKEKIAQNYLIPKQMEINGLEKEQLEITDEAILKIATNYTREAGVRNLERQIGSICRGKAVEYAESIADKNKPYNKVVGVDDLHKYLGVGHYEDDMVNDEVDEYYDKETGEKHRRHTYGVVNGLAYMGSGNGGLLMFEASLMSGHGNLKTTGQLGSVIAESADIALSWVRSNAFRLGLTASPEEDLMKDVDIHLHAPAGAIPKDGPSAGVAMTVTFISLFAKKPVPRNLAMTGEMTLRGKILPVGGIREKLLGAHLAGIQKVLLPYHTKKLVEQEDFFKTFLKNIDLEIVYVKYIWDVLAEIWPEENFPVLLDSHI